MVIKRDSYIRRLISAKHNGAIKIVTGLRRCGKSYLLRKLFKRHLVDSMPGTALASPTHRPNTKSIIFPTLFISFIPCSQLPPVYFATAFIAMASKDLI